MASDGASGDMSCGPERIFLSPPHLSGEEGRLIEEALASNYIAPLGPMVEAFEDEFAGELGLGHALAVSSGTAAMHLALRVLGVKPGDRVLASTLTFIGSVSPIIYLGAVPVFIDSDPRTWNMDPELLEEELEKSAAKGDMPKAVVPTDLYGQCADYGRIQSLCDAFGVPMVVDAAESLGARYGSRSAGAAGRAAIFSFNGNKILTTSGGGMLTSQDKHVIGQARHLSQQARDPAPHYQHSTIGYNYRMSNILAAMGRAQLAILEQRVAKKRAIHGMYARALEGFSGLGFMPEASYGTASRWLTVITVDEEVCGLGPERLRLALEKENIESRPVWKPMHLQPVFKSCAVRGGEVSEKLFRSGLCLPSGTQLQEGDVQRVAGILVETLQRAAG